MCYIVIPYRICRPLDKRENSTNIIINYYAHSAHRGIAIGATCMSFFINHPNLTTNLNIVFGRRNPTSSLLRLANDKTPTKLTTNVTTFIQSANQFLRSWVKLRFPTKFCQLWLQHLNNLLISILFVHIQTSYIRQSLLM